MKRVAVLVATIFGGQLLWAGPPQRSVSPSRQFVIYGANAEVRGAVSDLAERTKTNILVLLRQRDDWKTPLVVSLEPQQANLPELPAADLRFSQTGFGLKLQLDLTISQTIDASLIERELLRAILLEMIYRKQSHIAAGTRFVEPADWLLDGILALAPGRDRGPLLEALSNTDKPMSLEKFLNQRAGVIDSAGRTLYRAYSFALVQMLTAGPDDPRRLAHYIVDLVDGSNEPLTILKSHFPCFAGDAEKVWQSALRRLKNLDTNELLTFLEADRRLDELLHLKISETNKPGKVATLEDLSRRKISTDEKIALNQLNHDLLLFVVQSNPVLRPIAREYQQIAALVARSKHRGIAKRLSRLEATRKQLTARMTDIDDYMNWFEATQMKNASGDFSDYLKAVDQWQPPTSKRRDPLTLYVDALDEQFEP